MRYPVAIHHEENTAYGVTVPDIPGCFSAGDSFDEALENTVNAINDHLELLAIDGETAPAASSIQELINNDDYSDATWGFVDIDTTSFMGKTEKLNVTLPTIVTRQVDKLVSSGRAKNRSAFLAEAAMEKVANYK